jgi:hypothetical protein
MNSNLGSNSFLFNLLNNIQSSTEELAFVKDGTYYNKLFEISFKIPDGWHVVNINTYNRIINDLKFQGLFEIAKEKFIEAFETPACFITKFDPESNEYDGIVSPTINFNIIPPESGSIKMTLEDHAKSLTINPEILPYHLVKEFKILNQNRIVPICGFNTIKIETEYLFEHKELKEPVMVEMDIIFIEYGEYTLDFSMTQCIKQNQTAPFEFATVLDSIVLKKYCG